jgi:sulfatase modifying factor 1
MIPPASVRNAIAIGIILVALPQGARSQSNGAGVGNACHTTPSGRTAMLQSGSGSPATKVQETVVPSKSKAHQVATTHTGWPAKPWPTGMVWIPGGTFAMGGSGGHTRDDEFPVHQVRVTGFWMDETEVTNAQFQKFVKATGYVTTAEKKPEWAELKKQLPPGTPEPPAANLVPGSLVFKPTKGPVPLNDYSQWWAWTPGASWKHPQGPSSSIAKQENYPVVHVSWADSAAYCKWAGKQLPTEAQFEFASRGGLSGKAFGWGDEQPSTKNPKINFWQGGFPYAHTPLDGYFLSAPVKSFPPNAYGLYEIIGNVWEWCDDWYRADYYKTLASKGSVTIDPTGPKSSLDPEDPYMPKRVVRGGSFLCNNQYCASFRPAARMKESPDTGMIHMGFRAIMTDAAWRKQAKR